jgi:hypothetical protein
MNPSTRLAATASLTAGVLVGSLAATTPADAQINPGYDNTPRWAVAQDANWETMTNLTMRNVHRVEPYGYRNGFCVVAGNRWDSGTFYGAGWGNIEARAFVAQDSPAGPCTQRIAAAALWVETSAIFTESGGRQHWLAHRGCDVKAFQWNTGEVLAWRGSGACSAPTMSGPGSNYQPGGYSANVIVFGQAYPDQPSSQFNIQWNNWPAFRR